MGEPVAGGRGKHRRLASAAGWGIAAVCLIWLLHDVHPREILAAGGRLSWWWVAAGVVFDILSYIAQGWRWELLLRARGDLGIWRTTQAIYAGLFTNEVVPMRVGELVRLGLVARWLRVPARAVLPSLLLERLMDGIWLAAAAGIATVFVPLPATIRTAAAVLGAAVILGFGIFAWVARRPAQPHPPSHHKASKVRVWLHPVVESMRDAGPAARLWTALGASGVVLLFQILAFWLIMRAAAIPLGFEAGAIVLLILHLGTMIPNAPANLGSYQFFVVVGLAVFGIDKTTATAFSFVVFLILTVPLWVIGVFALTRSGMTIATARAEGETSRIEAGTDSPDQGLQLSTPLRQDRPSRTQQPAR